MSRNVPGDPLKTWKWRQLQQKILKRDDYECSVCGEFANTVDHIKPRSKFPELMFDEDNLVAMCASHNSSKGNREQSPRITWVDESWFPDGVPRAYAGAGK